MLVRVIYTGILKKTTGKMEIFGYSTWKEVFLHICEFFKKERK